MIFVTGATGYMGSRLIRRLVQRGDRVRALVRRRVELACEIVHGDPLDASTYAESVHGCDAFVHLVGVPHPAPWKEPQFRAVDLRSVREAVRAATAVGVKHFVYVSVAPGADDEGVHPRARGVRGRDRRVRPERDHPATLVRPRPGPSLARRPEADLLVGGASARNARHRAPFGARDYRPDAGSTGSLPIDWSAFRSPGLART
jgi:nucleoside-diphosphate-sugar epimerase